MQLEWSELTSTVYWGDIEGKSDISSYWKLPKTLTNFTFDAVSDIFTLEVNAYGCPITSR